MMQMQYCGKTNLLRGGAQHCGYLGENENLKTPLVSRYIKLGFHNIAEIECVSKSKHYLKLFVQWIFRCQCGWTVTRMDAGNQSYQPQNFL